MSKVVTRTAFLTELANRRRDEVVVTTMGVVRPWGLISDEPLDFASADSAMGHAADFALGIALARPRRRVICLNGDGSMLMSLGTLVTVIASGVDNLVLVVMENRTYEITGNQSIPGNTTTDFVGMARAAGFPQAFRIDEPDKLERGVNDLLKADGPVFCSVQVDPGDEGPISRSANEEARYLKNSLAESARRLRKALSARPTSS